MKIKLVKSIGWNDYRKNIFFSCLLIGVVILNSCKPIIMKLAGVSSHPLPQSNEQTLKLAEKYQLPYDLIYRTDTNNFEPKTDLVQKIGGRLNFACLFDNQTGMLLSASSDDNCAFKIINSIKKDNYNGNNIQPDVTLENLLSNLIMINQQSDLNILNTSKKYVLIYSYASYFGKNYLKGLSKGLKLPKGFENQVEVIALNLDIYQ